MFLNTAQAYVESKNRDFQLFPFLIGSARSGSEALASLYKIEGIFQSVHSLKQCFDQEMIECARFCIAYDQGELALRETDRKIREWKKHKEYAIQAFEEWMSLIGQSYDPIIQKKWVDHFFDALSDEVQERVLMEKNGIFPIDSIQDVLDEKINFYFLTKCLEKASFSLSFLKKILFLEFSYENKSPLSPIIQEKRFDFSLGLQKIDQEQKFWFDRFLFSYPEVIRCQRKKIFKKMLFLITQGDAKKLLKSTAYPIEIFGLQAIKSILLHARVPDETAALVFSAYPFRMSAYTPLFESIGKLDLESVERLKRRLEKGGVFIQLGNKEAILGFSRIQKTDFKLWLKHLFLLESKIGPLVNFSFLPVLHQTFFSIYTYETVFETLVKRFGEDFFKIFLEQSTFSSLDRAIFLDYLKAAVLSVSYPFSFQMNRKKPKYQFLIRETYDQLPLVEKKSWDRTASHVLIPLFQSVESREEKPFLKNWILNEEGFELFTSFFSLHYLESESDELSVVTEVKKALIELCEVKSKPFQDSYKNWLNKTIKTAVKEGFGFVDVSCAVRELLNLERIFFELGKEHPLIGYTQHAFESEIIDEKEKIVDHALQAFFRIMLDQERSRFSKPPLDFLKNWIAIRLSDSKTKEATHPIEEKIGLEKQFVEFWQNQEGIQFETIAMIFLTIDQLIQFFRQDQWNLVDLVYLANKLCQSLDAVSKTCPDWDDEMGVFGLSSILYHGLFQSLDQINEKNIQIDLDLIESFADESVLKPMESLVFCIEQFTELDVGPSVYVIPKKLDEEVNRENQTVLRKKSKSLIKIRLFREKVRSRSKKIDPAEIVELYNGLKSGFDAKSPVLKPFYAFSGCRADDSFKVVKNRILSKFGLDSTPKILPEELFHDVEHLTQNLIEALQALDPFDRESLKKIFDEISIKEATIETDGGKLLSLEETQTQFSDWLTKISKQEPHLGVPESLEEKIKFYTDLEIKLFRLKTLTQNQIELGETTAAFSLLQEIAIASQYCGTRWMMELDKAIEALSAQSIKGGLTDHLELRLYEKKTQFIWKFLESAFDLEYREIGISFLLHRYHFICSYYGDTLGLVHSLELSLVDEEEGEVKRLLEELEFYEQLGFSLKKGLFSILYSIEAENSLLLNQALVDFCFDTGDFSLIGESFNFDREFEAFRFLFIESPHQLSEIESPFVDRIKKKTVLCLDLFDQLHERGNREVFLEKGLLLKEDLEWILDRFKDHPLPSERELKQESQDLALWIEELELPLELKKGCVALLESSQAVTTAFFLFLKEGNKNPQSVIKTIFREYLDSYLQISKQLLIKNRGLIKEKQQLNEIVQWMQTEFLMEDALKQMMHSKVDLDGKQWESYFLNREFAQVIQEYAERNHLDARFSDCLSWVIRTQNSLEEKEDRIHLFYSDMIKQTMKNRLLHMQLKDPLEKVKMVVDFLLTSKFLMKEVSVG